MQTSTCTTHIAAATVMQVSSDHTDLLNISPDPAHARRVYDARPSAREKERRRMNVRGDLERFRFII